MSNVKMMNGMVRRLAKGSIIFTHGALVALGVASVAHFGVDNLKHTSVSFADMGLSNARSAVAEMPAAPVAVATKPSLGDRWKLASFALVGATEDVVLESEQGLSEEMQRVRDWVAKRYRVSGEALEPVLSVAELSAREAGLDPLLLVAMMAIESSFNPKAESHMGAQGLMQVIPRWHMDKIGEDAGVDALFDPVFNVQVGTLVLLEGLQRYGSLQAALQYYGGARSDPEARYTKRVLAMKRQLASAARIADDA